MVKELCFTIACMFVVVLLGAQSLDVPKRGFSSPSSTNRSPARPSDLRDCTLEQNQNPIKWGFTLRSIVSKKPPWILLALSKPHWRVSNTQLGLISSPSGLSKTAVYLGIGYLDTFLGQNL